MDAEKSVRIDVTAIIQEWADRFTQVTNENIMLKLENKELHKMLGALTPEPVEETQ